MCVSAGEYRRDTESLGVCADEYRRDIESMGLCVTDYLCVCVCVCETVSKGEIQIARVCVSQTASARHSRNMCMTMWPIGPFVACLSHKYEEWFVCVHLDYRLPQ